MKALFTIVARNYVGLARVLRDSVARHGDWSFFIFTADDWDDLPSEQVPQDIISARQALAWPEARWQSMAFQYNLVEFCTAIKPGCFQFLMQQKGYTEVVYVDPDVYFFGSPDALFDELAKTSILLTPHILDCQIPFKGDYPDHLFLLNGTFNLGFVGVKKDRAGSLFLSWWNDRLESGCFFDNDRGMATDQKWTNLLPTLFTEQELTICRKRGWNMAPWNYHERKVIAHDHSFSVTDREADQSAEPLVFVHFSGYDYRGFMQQEVSHKNENATRFPDLQPIFEAYGKALAASAFSEFSGIPYFYGYFQDGKPILQFHRRIYRRLYETEGYKSNPFRLGPGSFHAMLQRKRMLIKAGSGSSPDKLTNKNLSGFDSQFKLIQWFFRVIFFFIGIRRYSLMVRFFRRFFTEENQLFLLDKKSGNKLQ